MPVSDVETIRMDQISDACGRMHTSAVKCRVVTDLASLNEPRQPGSRGLSNGTVGKVVVLCAPH